MSLPENKRPQSAGSSFKYREPVDPDGALGLIKPRTRIYSFGAAGTAATESRGDRRQEGKLSAAATDTGRRVHPDRGRDSAGTPALVSGRGREWGKGDGEADSTNNVGRFAGDHPGAGDGASAEVGADDHLGVVDLSKVSRVRKEINRRGRSNFIPSAVWWALCRALHEAMLGCRWR